MLIILPQLIGANAVWLTPGCVGAVTLAGIIIYSRYLNKKSDGEYHGIFMNKYNKDNFLQYSINAVPDEVEGVVNIIENRLENSKFCECVSLSLKEFLTDIIKTNDKPCTIDITLDVCDESVKINIKDLGVERRDDFTFKNKTEFRRKIDYTEVLGLNSNVIRGFRKIHFS